MSNDGLVPAVDPLDDSAFQHLYPLDKFQKSLSDPLELEKAIQLWLDATGEILRLINQTIIDGHGFPCISELQDLSIPDGFHKLTDALTEWCYKDQSSINPAPLQVAMQQAHFLTRTSWDYIFLDPAPYARRLMDACEESAVTLDLMRCAASAKADENPTGGHGPEKIVEAVKPGLSDSEKEEDLEAQIGVEARLKALDVSVTKKEKLTCLVQLIRDKGAVKGELLARYINVESTTFYTHYANLLAQIGVKKSRDRGGYYIDEDSAT